MSRVAVAEEVTTGPAPSPRVKQLEPADTPRWDAFVQDCPGATFFHLAGWKEAIERAFGHRTYYLYAETQGHIQGVLPLGHIRSRLFGNSLVSTPFGVYGGIAAETISAREALQHAACALADRLGVDYLEMRNRAPSDLSWPSKDLYVTFRREIHPDVETNLSNIPRKQRAMVRKGIKAGLVGEIDEDVECFYGAYS